MKPTLNGACPTAQRLALIVTVLLFYLEKGVFRLQVFLLSGLILQGLISWKKWSHEFRIQLVLLYNGLMIQGFDRFDLFQGEMVLQI